MADRILRCAVYTRKSTEDGLEQEFNSLDAQYEACTAYALSQRHEGWLLLPERYDDGGFSGGNLQRPGLTRLLADVAAGKVDIILLYKIDRLTRSLSDFARIVDVLDKAGASFVSITQSFNTTTSMGRLTLNMLLSFAQFEREVTGERIRDKIAASKRKGMWMGGTVPLGYDVANRRLIVNETEAQLVRHIMKRYLALGSVVALVDELAASQHLTKQQIGASGPHRGGVPFRRGTLYHLLSNPIYRGMIVHKAEIFPGEHPAIVSEDLFGEVQILLKQNAAGSSRRKRGQQPSLLVGLLEDAGGRAMTPSHASNGTARYRYYVTRPDLALTGPASRVPAHDIEKLVTERLAAHFADQSAVVGLASHDTPAQQVQAALQQADLTAAALRSGTKAAQAELLRDLLARVAIRADGIAIRVNPVALRERLGLPAWPWPEEPIVLTAGAARVRQGHQIRLVVPGPQLAEPPAPRQRDDRLMALLAEAFAARRLVLENPDRSLSSLASEHGRCRTRLGKLVAASCIAPELVRAALEGRPVPGLTAKALMSGGWPASWSRQVELVRR